MIFTREAQEDKKDDTENENSPTAKNVENNIHKRLVYKLMSTLLIWVSNASVTNVIKNSQV